MNTVSRRQLLRGSLLTVVVAPVALLLTVQRSATTPIVEWTVSNGVVDVPGHWTPRMTFALMRHLKVKRFTVEGRWMRLPRPGKMVGLRPAGENG